MNGYRTAEIYVRNNLAGYLSQTDKRYRFAYTKEYALSEFPPVSITMPKTERVEQLKTTITYDILNTDKA